MKKYTSKTDSSTYRLLLLIVMAGTTMLYALSMTLVNIILPQLQGALSATQEQISWVITLNVLATAIATPLTGSLVSMFGRRPVLILCSSCFTFATLACGFCDSLETLLIFRVIQGASGAPLMPLCQATLLQSYPRELHAKVNGVFGMAIVVGPALAPSLGGYLSETYDWRWVFFMMFPLGLMAVTGNWKIVSDAGREAKSKFDYLGFTLFSVSIVCLQLIVDRGEREDWLESMYIITLITFMTISFYMFLINTPFSSQPYLKFKIFQNKNYTLGVVLVFIYGSLNFTPLVLMPPMLQSLQGFPDLLVGSILATRGCGMIVGFFVASKMGRLDPRIGMMTGMVSIGVSGWFMSAFGINTPVETISLVSALQGFGCGLLWVPLAVITFSTMPNSLYPDASAFFHLLRNLGTSIFVGFSVTLLLRTSKIRYSEFTEKIILFDEKFLFPDVIGNGSSRWLNSLEQLALEIEKQAMMIGYNNTFFFYAAVCLATLPILALISVKKISD